MELDGFTSNRQYLYYIVRPVSPVQALSLQTSVSRNTCERSTYAPTGVTAAAAAVVFARKAADQAAAASDGWVAPGQRRASLIRSAVAVAAPKSAASPARMRCDIDGCKAMLLAAEVQTGVSTVSSSWCDFWSEQEWMLECNDFTLLSSNCSAEKGPAIGTASCSELFAIFVVESV